MNLDQNAGFEKNFARPTNVLISREAIMNDIQATYALQSCRINGMKQTLNE